MKKGYKGITLIALVVTIIILLILTGVTIGTLFGPNGLITKANEAKNEQRKAQAKHKVDLAVLSSYDTTGTLNLFYLKDNLNRIDGIVPIEEDIPGLPYDVIVDGFLITINVNGSTTVQGEAEGGTTEVGESEIGNKTPPNSSYQKIGDVYVNTPDLSYLDVRATYYIKYNGETANIEGRIDRIDAPTDWYDYSEGKKQWANIVTATNNNVSYWVWIPRYVYKINSSEQTVDVRFVKNDDGNTYLDESGNTVTLDGYTLPESFKFGEVNLPGYWMSKYEMSENGGEYIVGGVSNGEITINTSSTANSSNYTIFIDGIKQSGTYSLPHNITGLKDNKTYDICVTNGANVLYRKEVRPFEIKIEKSGLDLSKCYYITYDASGKMKVEGRMDKISEPKNWYNYAKKQWANMITVNGNQVSYWVYIPRYEYCIPNSTQMTDIIFIPETQKTADSGYTIPESFTFGGKDLAGYWMSKYEVSESAEVIGIGTEENTITFSTTATDGKTYEIYIDGKLEYTGALPHTVSGLTANKQYEVYILKENAMVYASDVTTKVEEVEIDLSQFDQNNTYYVTYNSDGGEILTKLSDGQPDNWYNYVKKQWANILTVNGENKAYWVYIPRYEYYIDSSNKTVDIKFIPKTQTTADPGYTIPESFKFGGVDLPGYWISKYEVSEQLK